jgi:hypothetical protein
VRLLLREQAMSIGGSGSTPQSANVRTRSFADPAPAAPGVPGRPAGCSAPPGVAGQIMRKKLLTLFTPGAKPMIQSAARSTSAVGRTAPATNVSAAPSWTSCAAWKTGSAA